MKQLNIVVEGNAEENFVNDVLVKHFALIGIYISVRKVRTGWDSNNQKPAKGGLIKYVQFRNDIVRWIKSENHRPATWYTSMLDLYAFPVDNNSPFSESIRKIQSPLKRVEALEDAIFRDIGCDSFIPYVQLHEFEALVLVDPDRLLTMFPDQGKAVTGLKHEISGKEPEEINDCYETAPSKRIIKFIPDYAGQKAQVGPLVVEDIGLTSLRRRCPHFNTWITKIESL